MATMADRRERPGLRALWASLDGRQRRTLLMMTAVVVGLHVVGFLTLIALVAPKHYHLGNAGLFTIGIGVTAYTLGLRHAFDADHISAIDNTTRKLMSEGKRPLSVGFWFSLGHSTVVFALAFLISVGVRALDGPLKNHGSNLHAVTSWIGSARFRRFPVPHSGAQRRDPAGNHQGVPRDEARDATTNARSRSSSTAAAS